MEANQILSSDSEVGTFEHAACVLFVEIQVTNCARKIGASPRTLKNIASLTSRGARWVLRLWMRGIKQTIMSAELETGTFEHAGCEQAVEPLKT